MELYVIVFLISVHLALTTRQQTPKLWQTSREWFIKYWMSEIYFIYFQKQLWGLFFIYWNAFYMKTFSFTSNKLSALPERMLLP